MNDLSKDRTTCHGIKSLQVRQMGAQTPFTAYWGTPRKGTHFLELQFSHIKYRHSVIYLTGCP